ncbi:hypothetical protein M5X17_10500 [Paenibacillus alvei]|uniref:hypothetical protein n=1 Tax=Paenibacillus alvei TaxID=44250 RepID=UPI0022812EB6|nr:hypothetical protein [Paenibacillus alvei]MCY9734177.1 hypothetical protein [Paenibacillus alvei]
MANRYANLVGSKKISEDWNNINIGFDRVQAEMDTKGTPSDSQAKADAARDAAIASAAAALAAHKERGAGEHPNATPTADGFMSVMDKKKLEAATPAATPGAIAQRDASGRMKAAAPAAADDVARKAEIDAVQGNLDSHAKNTEIHVTAEDHKKLDGIAEGAEVNQHAFAKVNDILAQTKSDEIIIKGGVGIKITTNPTTNEVTVTAVGDATPGAHGSSHTELGADPIPNATETEGGLMSSADKAMVKQQGDTIQLHEKRLDVADAALDDAPPKQIELKPGVQVLASNGDSAFRLGEIRGKTEIRDGIGIVNVTNPYAIATSGNMLPPIMEWEQGIATGDSCVITEPYAVTIDAQKIGGSFVRYYVPVSKSSVYTFTVESQGTNSLAYMYLCKADKTRIDNVKLKGTVTTTDASAWLEVVLNTLDSTGTSPVIGTAKYRNPMLVPGDKPQPFALQSRSMWAAECQLVANPADGTNADVLYLGDDGLPYVLEKWKKVTLDGSLNWSMGEATFSGGKQVKVAGMAIGAVSGSGHAVKFDGKYIPGGSTGLAPDLQAVSVNGNFYISISNKDSGWGDNYTPSDAEIKAYFLGWKMGWWNSTTQKLDPWDGTQPTHEKRWVNVLTGKSMQTSLPTTQAEGYTPYRLQYLKAKPTVEAVKNYETGLTFSKGWNMVEVGSGIVIREKTNPYPNGDGTYSINTLSNPTKYRVDSISSVYRNNVRDVTYSLERRKPDSEYIGTLGYGFAKTSSFDSAAVYHVTYTMLDPTLTASISGSIAANLRGTVTDMVAWASDAERRLSVVETQKAEKDNAVAWIKPALLNSWESFGAPYSTVAYCIDRLGFVHIRGTIKNGSLTQPAFVLPKGYRPKTVLILVAHTDPNVGKLLIYPDGKVVPNEGNNVQYGLDTITSFLAEQ